MQIIDKTKLIFSLSLLIICMTGAIFWWVNDRAVTSTENRIQIKNIVRGVFELNTLTNEYLHYRSSRPYEQWGMKYNSLDGLISNWLRKADQEQSANFNSHEMDILTKISKDLDLVRTKFDLMKKKEVSEGYKKRLFNQSAIISQEIVSLASDLDDHESEILLKVLKRGNWILVLSLLMMALLVVSWTALTYFSLSKPIKALISSLQLAGEGHFSHQIDIQRKDEIGLMADAFNEMSRKRYKIETALKESEQRYRSVYDTTPLAFVVWDKDCNILEWNEQAEKTFEYSRKEVLGRNFFDLIIPEIEKEMVEQVVRDLLNGKLDTQVININITKSRNLIWCEWNNSILKDAKGHVTAAISLGLDITDRIKAEEELEEYRQKLEELVEIRTAELNSKNKELETFTYSVSHDLKAPLRGIDGYSRLLTEEYADKLDEEGLKFLSNVRQSAEQMNQLIEDLLAYSRTERHSIHKSAINLKAIIELLISERQHDIESGQIQIDIKLPFDSIHADSDTLRQVIGNYIDNAIKFAHKEKQPVVEVGGKENDDKWIVWVKDNGIGFEPKYQDRIFQIFQRLHRIEDYPGTGVGLAIVRKAVERMGGRVWAESTLGEGATFYIEIPKAP